VLKLEPHNETARVQIKSIFKELEEQKSEKCSDRKVEKNNLSDNIMAPVDKPIHLQSKVCVQFVILSMYSILLDIIWNEMF